ncbi:MAG: DUF2059 domain-containing protein [Flavobacteriaceae bacterium]|nr:DUF2059 domain-containing protein [Flavobacteriaceae bacterium]
MRSIFFTVLISFFLSANAQVDVFQKDIVTFININGTRQLYDNSQDEITEKLKNQIVKKEIPTKEWGKFKNKNKKQNLDKLVNDLAFAYRNQFSHDDVKKMIVFYKTEAAQKLINDKSSLTEEDDKVIDDFNKTAVAKKMDLKEKALEKDIAVIYSSWKREIFSQKMGEIIKKGYSKAE